MLEPDALKGARPVLRGGGAGDSTSLPDPLGSEAVTDMPPQNAYRGLRWSIAALMGLVAAVAVFLSFALAWMRPAPPAPGYVLDRLPLQMQRLRPGMTERRVWAELGLAGYHIQRGAGGGPDDCYWTAYSPGPGYGLVLSFDETVSPPRLVGARLDYPQGVIHTPNH
jgi:hypothetical protein